MKQEFPVELADRCVKCGLCAPHCPTYRLSRMEPESPRGRIAIMTAIAKGELDNTAGAREHLDHCLACQACEAVCPANVPYLQLLDAHRAAHRMHPGWASGLLQRLPLWRRGRLLLRLGLRAAALLRDLFLPLLFRLRLQRPMRLLSLAPSTRIRQRLPRQPQADAQVLIGCLGDLANAQTLQALAACAQALQLRLDFLPGGHCCGALAQHHGLLERAQAVRQSLRAERRPGIPLLSVDSACTNQLRDGDEADCEEVSAFLARQDWSGVALRALPQRVLIHQPCSHRNGLREVDAARKLLRRIPQLQLEELEDAHCCGAAGTHMLDEPARADELLIPKLRQASEGSFSALITTNIGCALHLQAGLRRLGLQQDAAMPTVMHPVELLARQIEH